MTLRPQRMSARKLLARARKHTEADARATKEDERRRKMADKLDSIRQRQRSELEVQRQHGLAVKQTMKAEQRVQKLTTLLHASLAEPPKPLDFDDLKSTVELPPLDLGTDAEPEPPPRWKDFAPSYRSAILHLIYRREQYSKNVAESVAAYELAVTQHHEREKVRLQRVAAATRRRDDACTDKQRELREKNREVDAFRQRVRDRDRHAATEYFRLVLDRAPKDPSALRKDRRVGYAPESATVTVEWVLPQTDVIPVEKEYRYDESLGEIVVHKRRSAADIHRVYFEMAAQIALRTLNTIFGSDPYDLVENIVFNGVVEEVGEITGRSIRPCVFTLCATRTKFQRLKLDDVADAVEIVRKQFGARMSPHPEDFDEVPALRPFILADPDVIELTEDANGDSRPDLLSMPDNELEGFLTELLDRMGIDVQRFTRTDANDLVCIAFDPTPVVGGTIVVLTRFGDKPVTPSDIRSLNGFVSKESAIKGMFLTSARFHPTTLGMIRGKPLELYDGPSVLALCHQHHLPARLGRIANITSPEPPAPTTVFIPTQRDSANHLSPTSPKIS